MKKLILAAITLTTAAGIFAQGTVTFNNRIAGTGTTHVWSGPAYLSGNSSGDVPAGTTVYGSGYFLIGTVGGMSASTTMAQLLGANGASAPESSLLPSTSPATTFRTGAGAGNIVGSTATFDNIPLDAAAASFELAVWDNSTGLYPTWTQASSAVASGVIFGGRSSEFTLSQIGGTTFTPPSMISSVAGQGLQTFAIVTSVPEPTTVALAGLGAAALLIFRRRK
jgi:hypothetical protein